MPKQRLTTSREWLQEQLRDPEFRELWEKTAIARAIAEHNPSIETLQRLARGLGQWFIVAVGPVGPRAGEVVPLPDGAEVLEDVTTADGSRVVTAAG